MATTYEYTSMYLSTTAETIVAYPTRVSIQMLVLYFDTAADQIALTDAVSDSDFDDADDVIVDLCGAVDHDIIILDWSAKPRHVHGLKSSTVDTGCKVYIYVA